MLAVFPGWDDHFSPPPPPCLTQGHRMQIQLQLDGAATLLRVVDCNVSERSSGVKKNYQNKIKESPCLSSALASATSTSGSVPVFQAKMLSKGYLWAGGKDTEFTMNYLRPYFSMAQIVTKSKLTLLVAP